MLFRNHCRLQTMTPSRRALKVLSWWSSSGTKLGPPSSERLLHQNMPAMVRALSQLEQQAMAIAHSAGLYLHLMSARSTYPPIICSVMIMSSPSSILKRTVRSWAGLYIFIFCVFLGDHLISTVRVHSCHQDCGSGHVGIPATRQSLCDEGSRAAFSQPCRARFVPECLRAVWLWPWAAGVSLCKDQIKRF